MNDIQYSDKINGGQGELRVELKATFDNFSEEFSFTELVNHARILQIDKNNKKGRVIYTGYIDRNKSIFKSDSEQLSLHLVGLFTKLTDGYYGTLPIFEVSENDDPSEIGKKIIDSLLLEFPGFISYSASTIQSVRQNVQYDYKRQTWLEAMQNTRELAGANWYWHIDGQGNFNFKEKKPTADHSFQIGTHAGGVETERSIGKMVNYVIVNFDGATEIGEDTASIAKYGRRIKIIDDTNIKDQPSALQRISDELKNANPRIRTRITVNKNYDIESIKVGQTCKVLGVKKGSTTIGDNMQIVALNYKPEEVVLILDDYNSFPDSVKKLVS